LKFLLLEGNFFLDLFLLCDSLVANEGVPLLLDSLLPPLPGGLGLRTLGIHLLLEDTFTGLLGLSLVDLHQTVSTSHTRSSITATTARYIREGGTNVLNQSTSVLEGVTLGEVVELVVEVLVDLSLGTVLDEETAEDTEAAHPEDLGWHTGILGTLPLTETSVATSTLGIREDPGAGTGVHGGGLLDDKTVTDELTDSLA
jgi:hypothetical protein